MVALRSTHPTKKLVYKRVREAKERENNPVEASIKTAEVLPMLFFFEVLKKSEPKLIGGKIPEDGFYYSK
ncbi:hypothetical protein PN36_13880 [Candidatus Thiomargarita nelsonii]|uniref:Uncharacterized protein n=1 Tax=Candidatus Thiomargarita nelsonii TaxID=1003181 RepID=A0A0A6P539_9GAMM|nr:hypothetical protein PN36_13880 [Candidatus Thiomargarita nelsonii]